MNLSERYSQKLQAHNNSEVNLDGVLVQLEVTNACNHKCIFCPNVDSSRKKKMMDFDFAKRIMEECAGLLCNDKKICFHMNGEPLLYKQLPELVKLSKVLGYSYSFITTNGSVASDVLLKRLFDEGLDSIKFSINAGTRETYRKIHGADDFDKAVSALQFAYDYRKTSGLNYKIFVSCVGIEQNYNELKHFEEFASQYSDEVVFYYPCSYAGQKIQAAKSFYKDMSDLDIKTFQIKHTLPCSVLWNSINVTCEGYLALCCSEADNRLIIEDLNHMSVKEAWLGDKMNSVRQGHMDRNIQHMPCYSCIYEQEYLEENIDKELFALSWECKNGGGR